MVMAKKTTTEKATSKKPATKSATKKTTTKVAAPVKKDAHSKNDIARHSKSNVISIDRILTSLAKHEEDEGITLYQLCKTDTAACLILCDRDAMNEWVSYPIDKSLPGFLNKIKKIADKGNLNAIRFWTRATFQDGEMEDDKLLDILVKNKWLGYVSDDILTRLGGYIDEDNKNLKALRREIAHRKMK